MQSELVTVLDALRNDRNITLVSSSNLKRADLIHEAFRILREQGTDAITYYIDIANTNNLDELSKLFADIVVGKGHVFLNQIFYYLSALEKRVYIAIDNLQQFLQYQGKVLMLFYVHTWRSQEMQPSFLPEIMNVRYMKCSCLLRNLLTKVHKF